MSMVKANPPRGGRPSAMTNAARIVPPCATATISLPGWVRFTRATAARTRWMTSTKLSPFAPARRPRTEGVRLLLPAQQKVAAVEPLPIAEMLLGKVLVLVNFRGREISRCLDRFRRLHRARQMTVTRIASAAAAPRTQSTGRRCSRRANRVPVDPALVDAHWAWRIHHQHVGVKSRPRLCWRRGGPLSMLGQSLLPASVPATRSLLTSA